jgi:hypothetical protein
MDSREQNLWVPGEVCLQQRDGAAMTPGQLLQLEGAHGVWEGVHQ